MFSKHVLLSLQYVLTELFFLYRQHCVLFMSLERCLNSWRCSCQPPKTCWMRRTMVISETLLSKAMTFLTGWCTCYLSVLFGRICWGVFVWFVSSQFYAVKANVLQKEGICMILLIRRTFTWHGDRRNFLPVFWYTSEWVEWESLWFLSNTLPKGALKCTFWVGVFCVSSVSIAL